MVVGQMADSVCTGDSRRHREEEGDFAALISPSHLPFSEEGDFHRSLVDVWPGPHETQV